MEEIVWNGRWSIGWKELEVNDLTRNGTCRFSSDGGAILEIHNGTISTSFALATTGMYSYGLNETCFATLYGIDKDGTHLVLCDALSQNIKLSFQNNSSETFTGTTVFSAEHAFDPNALITQMRFEIQLLNDWIRISRSELARRLDNKTNHGKIYISIPLYRSSRMCAELRIELHPITSPEKRESGSYHCYIMLEYLTGETLENICSDVLWKIQSLFAFCFGVYPAVSHMQFRQVEGDQWINVYRCSVNTKEEIRLSSSPPISFSSLGSEGLSKLSDNWIKLSGDERYGANILTSLLGSWNMPIDLLLMAATTMLESLARANRDNLYNPQEFKQLIKPIIEAASDELKQRVAGLLKLLQQPSYGQLLNEAYEEVRPWSENLIPNWKRFKKEQQKLRNVGAHGKNSVTNSYLQANHYNAQIVLGYIILMKRLGLSTAIINRFEQSSFLNAARWRISRQYSTDTEASEHLISNQ